MEPAFLQLCLDARSGRQVVFSSNNLYTFWYCSSPVWPCNGILIIVFGHQGDPFFLSYFFLFTSWPLNGCLLVQYGTVVLFFYCPTICGWPSFAIFFHYCQKVWPVGGCLPLLSECLVNQLLSSSTVRVSSQSVFVFLYSHSTVSGHFTVRELNQSMVVFH